MKRVITGLWRKKYRKHQFLLVLELSDIVGQWQCSEYEESWNDFLLLSTEAIRVGYTYISDCRNTANIPADILQVIPELQARMERVKHESSSDLD